MQFYTDDADLLDNLGALFSDALRAGESVAAVITRSHRSGSVEQLITQGIDVDEVTNSGRLAVGNASGTLNGFTDDYPLHQTIRHHSSG